MAGPRIAPDEPQDVTRPGPIGFMQDTFAAGRLSGSMDSSRLAQEEAADEVNDELFRITGVRFPNPYAKGPIRWNDGKIHVDNPLQAPLLNPLAMPEWSDQNPVGRWKRAIADLSKSNPRVAALQPKLDGLDARALEISRAAERQYIQATTSNGIPGQIAGGLIYFGGNLSTVNDPTAIGQLFAGPLKESRTLLGTFTRWATAGALGSAVGEIPTALNRERLGLEYTASDFATAVGLGAAVGGAFGVGGAYAFDRRFGARPSAIVRREMEMAGITSPTVAEIEAALPPGPREETAAAIRKFESSEAREAATEDALGPLAVDPEVLRSIDEADELLRDLGETPEPPVRRQADPIEQADLERVMDERPVTDGATDTVQFRGRQRAVSLRRLNPANIEADPARFQYKRYTGATGDTGTLSGAEVWDPVSSGKAIVFEQSDGRMVIADGHQRLALAKRAQAAGQDVALDAVVMREVDGWTDRDVRHYAAKKNLAEGAGDPLDVAAILKEAPDLLDNAMPLSRPLLRTGAALARLDDVALGAVRNGLITPEQGAVIARVLPDNPELHMAVADLFARDPPRTIAEAEFIAREALAIPAYREQASQLGLFGDAPLISGARERGAILGEAIRILRTDRRVFGMLGRFSNELEATGNVLAQDANERRAQMAATLVDELNTLATRAGPVSDLLREIATDAVENKTSVKAAGDRFANEVLALLDERGLLALKTGAPTPRPPPERVAPPHEIIHADVDALEIGAAQDMDDVALRQSLAEVAVERAMRGETPPPLDEDALGITPEADLEAIDRALADLEALGEPTDPTVREAAAQWLAAADEEMEFEARMRLEPKAEEPPAPEFTPAPLSAPPAPTNIDPLTLARDPGNTFNFTGAGVPGQPRAPEAVKPLTFTAAREAREKVEPPFHPLDFDAEDKLRTAMDKATLPELAAAAAQAGIDAEGSRTAIEAAMLRDWREAQPPRAITEPVRRTGLKADAVVKEIKTRLRNAHGRKDDFFEAVGGFNGSIESFVKALGADQAQAVFDDYALAYDTSYKLETVSFAREEAAAALARLDAFRESRSLGSPKFALSTGDSAAGPIKVQVKGDQVLFQSKKGKTITREMRARLQDWRTYVEGQGEQVEPVLRVDSVVVDESLRGQGLGLDLYLRALEEARSLGRTFISDGAVSPAAVRIYDALERRGYAVTRNPTAKEVGSFIRSGDGHPVFKVDPTPPARMSVADNAPAAPISTPEQITKALTKSVGGSKKIVNGLLNLGRLKIVAGPQELPLFDVEAGRFAMDARKADVGAMIAAGDVKMRMVNAAGNAVKKRGNAETIRYEHTLRNGAKMSVVMDYFDGQDGSVNVVMDINKRMTSRVGEAKDAGAVKTDARTAAEAFGTTLAFIAHDMKERGGKPVYSFAGGDTDLSGFYARLLSMKNVRPEGYKAFMRIPDGTYYLMPESADPALYGKRMHPITPETQFGDFSKDASRVLGYSLNGVAYLNAAALKPERAMGVLLHEVGVHIGMEPMIGTTAFRGVLDEVMARVKAEDPDFIAARRMVPDDTPAHLIAEETLAYGVQRYADLMEGSRFKTLIDRLVATVRAWLWKQFPELRRKLTLTMADYHALAIGALRRESGRPFEGVAGEGRAAMERAAEPLITPVRGIQRTTSSYAQDMRRIIEMPLEQLKELHRDIRAQEDADLVLALGEKDAADFKRMNRERDSPHLSAAQGTKLDNEFNQRFGDLTPDQEALIYGSTGDPRVTADDVKLIIRALEDGDSLDAADAARFAMRRLDANTFKHLENGTALADDYANMLLMRKAFQKFKEEGVAVDEIPGRIASAMVNSGYASSKAQADELVGYFVRDIESLRGKFDRLLSNNAAPERAEVARGLLRPAPDSEAIIRDGQTLDDIANMLKDCGPE